jgi:hypothetical protein
VSQINQLGHELLLHPPYSPDLPHSDFFLFADLKRMLAGKKFSSNEEVIAETETYFEAREKSKTGIEKLFDRWNLLFQIEWENFGYSLSGLYIFFTFLCQIPFFKKSERRRNRIDIFEST